MSIEALLNHFKARVPWPTMRNILHTHNLPVGQGWVGTIAKLMAYEELGASQAKELNALEDPYLENVLAGEKAIRFIEVKPEDAAALAAAFKGFDIPKNPFATSYPFPLDEENLAKVDKTSLLAGIEDLGHALAFVFCTKRFVTERQELNLEGFKEETQEELRQYDEIITVKHRMRQFVDVVVLWKEEGFAEIRIDLGEGISSDDQHLALQGLIATFNAVGLERAGVKQILGQPVNLFPLVDALYDSDEGRVCELGFITDGASIKTEKMRRKEVDLRAEAYHMAGKKAVHHITPFKLGVIWSIQDANEKEQSPELLLPGSVRTLSEKSQCLYDARITNCCGLEDFHFVVNKMREYLEGGEDEAAGVMVVAAN